MPSGQAGGTGQAPDVRAADERTSQLANQLRRVPRQARSKQRVEDILDATAELVLERGVDALSTRAVADRADVPVASLYQYFADKEGVLLALLERDLAEVDHQVATDLRAAVPTSMEELVETAMRSFVKVYTRRPAFVEVWMRARGHASIRSRGRERNVVVARMLRDYAVETGLVAPEMPLMVALLVAEVGDRLFELAYEDNLSGDPEILAEGTAMIASYLARYAVEHPGDAAGG